MQPAKIHAATGHDIREILGPVDEEIIMAIINTGATSGEIAEASEWLDDDDNMRATLEKKMGERVNRVYEILQDDRDRMNQDER